MEIVDKCSLRIINDSFNQHFETGFRRSSHFDWERLNCQESKRQTENGFKQFFVGKPTFWMSWTFESYFNNHSG